MNQNEKELVKILLVDDQSVNLDVLQQVLATENYDLYSATRGEDALKLLLNNEFACCLLDIRMPDVDGFQLAEFIRKDSQLAHLPIIFVTAEARDQNAIFKGYEKGAVDFLIKPLEPLILRSKVSVFADLYRQRKALERTKEIEEFNEKLKKLNNDLRIANDDLSHFTQMAAHDLREPLRMQLNLIELLEQEFSKPIPDSVQFLFDGLHRGVNKSLGMIDDFRSLSQIDYKELFRKPTSLKKVIEQCLEPYMDKIESRKITIQYDEFPESILIYDSLAARLYDNLIKNALDHVHVDSFILHFTAKQGRDSKWSFGVLNTESMVKKEQYDYIFKMNRTADPRSSGSGIGLAICKKIIERHSGDIKVESNKNSVHFIFNFGA